MARSVNRLTAEAVRTLSKVGKHADGNGLYLQVTPSGGRNYVFVYRFEGKRRELGLGKASDVRLEHARDRAREAYLMVKAGRDPIAEKRAHFAETRKDNPAETEPGCPTFADFSATFIAGMREGWRNAKHSQQWTNSLRQHAAALDSMPVDQIKTNDVLEVLRPIWTAKPETARRVRGRIERVLAAAMALGHRPRDEFNPAQWRGHLDALLPKSTKLARGHHPAMPYGQVGAFMRQLRDRDATAARLLEFIILTAARTGEAREADWSEIDRSAWTWTVPADRMKTNKPHTVPLSSEARRLLAAMGDEHSTGLIFPGHKEGRPLSIMACDMLLRRMKAKAFTVHGFRSAFKDWALDETEFPDELSEEALSHIVGSKVRRAYRRGEALERRRRLMQEWADYLTGAPALKVAA